MHVWTHILEADDVGVMAVAQQNLYLLFRIFG